jgi:hypothetical protein
MQMPWTSKYAARGAEVRYLGHTLGEELCDANRSVLSHAYPDGFHYVLVDFSRVEALDAPLADLLQIAEHNRQYLLRNPSFLLAVIAPQAHVSGLMKTFARYMEGTSQRAAIVRTRDEAVAWLDAEMADTA